MMKDIIDLGDSTKFNIEDEWYHRFCGQEEKCEKRSDRAVFQKDWQRFLWAFILGIYVGKRTPISKKTKIPPFGTEVFKNRNKILKLMIGLSLQERYMTSPDNLKKDFEVATEKDENLGRSIKIAIEEYANTGFSIIANRRPGYIENLEDVIDDILSDRGFI